MLMDTWQDKFQPGIYLVDDRSGVYELLRVTSNQSYKRGTWEHALWQKEYSNIPDLITVPYQVIIRPIIAPTGRVYRKARQKQVYFWPNHYKILDKDKYNSIITETTDWLKRLQPLALKTETVISS